MLPAEAFKEHGEDPHKHERKDAFARGEHEITRLMEVLKS